MRPSNIRLIIDSRLDQVEVVGVAVQKLTAPAPISAADRYQVELCLVEAVTNAIVHAYDRERGHAVDVWLDIDADHVRLRVTDTGRAMDLDASTELTFDPEDLDNLPEGGMGLHMIREFMTHVSYESAEGRNTLTLVKRFGERHGTPGDDPARPADGTREPIP